MAESNGAWLRCTGDLLLRLIPKVALCSSQHVTPVLGAQENNMHKIKNAKRLNLRRETLLSLTELRTVVGGDAVAPTQPRVTCLQPCVPSGRTCPTLGEECILTRQANCSLACTLIC